MQSTIDGLESFATEFGVLAHQNGITGALLVHEGSAMAVFEAPSASMKLPMTRLRSHCNSGQ
jgi:hypothetical protein